MMIKDLFEGLKALGYTIALEEENIRLSYRGPGRQPDEAKTLIDALRGRKAEAMGILRKALSKPYLDLGGSVVIPFDSDPSYHWWAGGQSVEETMREITGGKRRP